MNIRLWIALLSIVLLPGFAFADPWKNESGHGRYNPYKGQGETPPWARGKGYWDGYFKHQGLPAPVWSYPVPQRQYAPGWPYTPGWRGEWDDYRGRSQNMWEWQRETTQKRHEAIREYNQKLREQQREAQQEWRERQRERRYPFLPSPWFPTMLRRSCLNEVDCRRWQPGRRYLLLPGYIKIPTLIEALWLQIACDISKGQFKTPEGAVPYIRAATFAGSLASQHLGSVSSRPRRICQKNS